MPLEILDAAGRVGFFLGLSIGMSVSAILGLIAMIISRK